LLASIVGCNESPRATENPITKSEALVMQLRSSSPTAKITMAKGHVQRVHGPRLATGASPRESSERFRTDHAGAFGIAPGDLAAVAPKTAAAPGESGLGLMFDKATGRYKYRLYRYNQMADGLRVTGGELRTLVRDGGQNPVVWAKSTIRNLQAPFTARGKAARSPELGKTLEAVQRAWQLQPRRESPPREIAVSGPVERVVFAGTDAKSREPTMAIEYQVNSKAPESSWTVIADAQSGDILDIQNNDSLEDVLGTVRAWATPSARAMDCDEELLTELPYAQVTHATLGTFHANGTGAFNVTNPGTEALVLSSPVGGQYFDVTDYAGQHETLSQSVVPPGPADFLHNPLNATDALRAQSNAYVHANRVRDYLLSFVPNFPTISTQQNFAIVVNRTDSYCPGNAWYSSGGPSMNFCVSSATYGNSAFGSVIHHEYGHHIVNAGGSGQGAYGEGMADVVAVLLSDDPGLGYGFYLNSCTTPLRTADNDCQYSATSCSSCGSASHACGRLLSGIAWDIRNALQAVEPTTYRSILSALFLNSVPMHTGTTIDASIAEDLLTLDDNDGNLDNGSPHYTQICAGFAAHGLSCPPISSGLGVSPDTEVKFEGPSGGPFTPETSTFQVTNFGPDVSIAYAVQVPANAPWLTITNPTGEVALGQTVTVSAAIDQAVANQLPNGAYQAQLNFVNTTNGVGNEAHTVSLQVGQPLAVFSEDFSTGLGKFTLDTANANYWHRTSACRDSLTGHTAPGSLYFGSDSTCTFALGDVTGSVTSSDIVLSDTSAAKLDFNYYLATENSSTYDVASVQVSVNGGAYQVVASNNKGGVDLTDGAPTWQQATVDLSSILVGLSSATIRLRFFFDTIDSAVNGYAGFYVDDVVVSAMPTSCTSNAQCDDGLVCNGAEQCSNGGCVAGVSVACDDGIACTVDACSETLGCVANPNNTACSDGAACNGSEVCSVTLGCVAGVALDCNDGSLCTTDTCSETLGCQHTQVTCSDGNACTTDSCNSNTGCSYVPAANGTSCTDDGDVCTSDVCSAGVCTHPSSGTCGNTPCSAFCQNPVKFTGVFQSGNLGTGATCHETTGNVYGGNCGNFAPGRTLTVNGQAMPCNSGNWPSLPPKVNGGYCVQTTSGSHPWAYFVTW
jgi:hypothetical protein